MMNEDSFTLPFHEIGLWSSELGLPQETSVHKIIFRIVHGQIDLLTPFDPRAETFRFNVELSADHHGHTQTNFFRAKGSLLYIFQNSF